jgi:uncharacterized protein (DUF924 family)
MSDAKRIVDFWIDEVGPKRWYQSSDQLDKQITSEFEGLWKRASSGEFGSWLCNPDTALGLIILLDQFPRNMYRGTDLAYASDAAAVAATKRSIVMGHDLKVPEPQRQFFYMPLMHSESLMDQERCVRLIALRMPKYGTESLKHAQAHRDVIRQFGRFPYRNAYLGRPTTEPEVSYLDQGGYRVSMETYAA